MAITTGKGNLLVDKGEKIGLGVAAVVGVLLLGLGLKGAFDRPQPPDEFAKGLETKAGQLTSTMNGPPGDIAPVPKSVGERVDATAIAAVQDRSNFYDPTQPPDTRRTSPVILSLVEGQADMAVLKVLANDLELERDPMTGEVTKVKVGVVGAKDPGAKIDPELQKKFLQGVRNRFRSGQIPKEKKEPMAGGGMLGGPPGGGMFGGPPGGGMLGGPPGGGMLGGPGLGVRGGGLGPPGGARGAGFLGGETGPPGGFGMMGGGASAGKDLEVSYIEAADDEEIEKQMNGRRLAITIHPTKMVVLQAAFPYRAQLEKFKAALRYKELTDLYAHPEDMPTFYGVDVQRRAYGPKGDLLENWQPVDLAANSQQLRAVKIEYNEEPADLKRVELHEDHMLIMPLPHELAGKYPEMKLKTIKDSIDKIKKADPKNTVARAPKTKLGEGNPFKREEAAHAGLYNPSGGAGEMGGLFPVRGKKEKGEPGTTAAPEKYEPPDFVYVRAYDADIRDGLTYEYRMRVKVKNPNYGKKGQVSKESDADVEELPPQEEHWYVFPQKVKMPQAGYFYAIDPIPLAKTIKALPAPDKEKGQAVIQFQQWMDFIYPTSKLKEPVGDWVQSELIATRGQFVYGRTFSPLPFWSPTENAFVLREIPGEVTPKGKEPRRGVELAPLRPGNLLAVEVAGGKPSNAAAKVPPNVGEKTNRGGLVDDQAATEVLFLLPDGTLEVRTSARDKADTDRKEREDHFKKWMDDTEKKNPTTPSQKKGGGGIDF
jgi:hypothetical protein